MNARKLIPALGLSLILSVSAYASAQQKPDNPELVAQLERMASDVDWKTRTMTGKPLQIWQIHRAKIRHLIDQLKSGQSVDPKEIDELLKEPR